MRFYNHKKLQINVKYHEQQRHSVELQTHQTF